MTHGEHALVPMAQIHSPHGLSGEVRVHSFTTEPEQLGTYGPLRDEAGREFTVESFRNGTKGPVVRFAGINDRNSAETVRGVRLFVERNRLPEPAEGEYYHTDLLGLAVEAPTGVSLGTVTAVRNFGAGDLLEIAAPGGDNDYIPFTDAAVPTVDLAAGCIVANPIEISKTRLNRG